MKPLNVKILIFLFLIYSIGYAISVPQDLLVIEADVVEDAWVSEEILVSCELKNVSDSPIEIIAIESSCSCAGIKFLSKNNIIESSQSVLLQLELNQDTDKANQQIGFIVKYSINGQAKLARCYKLVKLRESIILSKDIVKFDFHNEPILPIIETQVKVDVDNIDVDEIRCTSVPNHVNLKINHDRPYSWLIKIKSSSENSSAGKTESYIDVDYYSKGVYLGNKRIRIISLKKSDIKLNQSSVYVDLKKKTSVNKIDFTFPNKYVNKYVSASFSSDMGKSNKLLTFSDRILINQQQMTVEIPIHFIEEYRKIILEDHNKSALSGKVFINLVPEIMASDYNFSVNILAY